MTEPFLQIVDDPAHVLREARIVIPQCDNDGHSIAPALAALENALCCTFNGFTKIPGMGGWQNSGTLYLEATWCYDIAADTTRDTAEVLKRIVVALRDRARQLCVYCRFPDGHVELI